MNANYIIVSILLTYILKRLVLVKPINLLLLRHHWKFQY